MGKLAILILAAGSASRMGKLKQLLPYNRTTLLGHAIKEAENTPADAVFCVLGANSKEIEKKIRENVTFIENPNWEQGLGSSIVSGITYLEETDFDRVLIMLADQPRIDVIFLTQLIGISEVNPQNIVASDYGVKKGVPAIFPKKYFYQLSKLTGDTGAKELLNSESEEIIALIAENKVQDIDTPEDYTRLLKN